MRSPGTPPRPSAPRTPVSLAGVVRLLQAALVAATLTAVALPGSGEARAQPTAGTTTVRVYRNLYNREGGLGGRPQAEVPPTQGLPVRDEVWRAEGVSRLAVVSPDPAVNAVFRLRPLADEPDGLRLVVILVPRLETREYLYTWEGERLTDGSRVTQQRFRLGTEGLETGLVGPAGPVRVVEVQDRGTVEVRIVRDGPTLVLRVVPPDEGGRPSGALRPPYEGKPLVFPRHGLLAAGYTENGLGALRIVQHVVLRVNGVTGSDKDVVMGRLLLTQQLYRTRHLGLWVEAGGGVVDVSEHAGPSPDPDASWSAGLTLFARWGDWGGSLHWGTVDGPAVLEALAGWQFSERFAGVLALQQVKGITGYGLGGSVAF